MAEALTPALPGYFRSQLKSMGYVYEESLVEANLAPQILALVPAETAVSYRVIPLDFEEETKLLSREIGRASCGKECRSRWSPYH